MRDMSREITMVMTVKKTTFQINEYLRNDFRYLRELADLRRKLRYNLSPVPKKNVNIGDCFCANI
jgi:hypothetical protein